MRNNKFGNKRNKNSKPYNKPEKSFEDENQEFEKKTRGPRIGKSKIQSKDNNRSRKFSKDSSFSPKKTPKKTSFEPDLNSGPIRLNKFIANSGICSRREADTYIDAGVVKVNGKVIIEMGYKVQPSDRVEFEGQIIKSEAKVYIVMNKPKGVMSTINDEQGQLTVVDIIKGVTTERIYPIARLDKAATGVLLLTNDGDLTKRLTNPNSKIKKIYHVALDKDLTKADMEKLVTGVVLEDGRIVADEVSYADMEDKSKIGIELSSDRNQIVRRMFESLGYNIRKLDRVYFAGLTKKNISRGQWRYLNEKEVSFLKMK
jgi:23S rRNA pseudouridine2605 synthase